MVSPGSCGIRVSWHANCFARKVKREAPGAVRNPAGRGAEGMMGRSTQDQPTKRSDTLTRRILALIGIVIFLGLPIYGVDDSSE